MIAEIQQRYFNPNQEKDSNGLSLSLNDIIANSAKFNEKKVDFKSTTPMTDQTPLNTLNRNNQQQQQPLTDQQAFLFEESDQQPFQQYGQTDSNGLPSGAEIQKLEVLNDKQLLAESTIKRIFLKLQKRDNFGSQQIEDLILRYYKKGKGEQISYDEFKHYYMKVLTLHQKCGDQCIHLLRFFIKIGFSTTKLANRQEVKPSKQRINPFSENIINNNNNINTTSNNNKQSSIHNNSSQSTASLQFTPAHKSTINPTNMSTINSNYALNLSSTQKQYYKLGPLNSSTDGAMRESVLNNNRMQRISTEISLSKSSTKLPKLTPKETFSQFAKYGN